MSRNGSGVYSKAVGTTATPNTTITSSQFNSTVDDLVDDLNLDRPVSAGGTGASSASQARTNLGLGTIATQDASAVAITGGHIKLDNGDVTDPSLTFGIDDNTGIYREASNQIGVTAGGVRKMLIAEASITTSVPVKVSNGAAATPALTFELDDNTGLYREAANQIGFSTGGVRRLVIAEASIVSELPVKVSNGAAATPSLTFDLDDDTGIYREGANQIGVTAGGAQVLGITETQLLAKAGTVAAPSVSFISDPDTGIYRSAANEISVSAGGALVLTVSATQLLAKAGTAADPSVSFISDDNTGLFRAAANEMGFATVGVERARFTETGFIVGNDTLLDPTVAEYGASMSTDGLLTVSRLGDKAFRFKRSNSGTVGEIYVGTTLVASVTESGGTVTWGAFCGAHPAQGDIPEAILPGTILETINEMCGVWGDDPNPNRTLPKVRHASVQSRAVYGVFFAWDDERDKGGNLVRPGQLHVASLGALFVRMAPEQTPIIGDLIESAGGGLGRVQADDLFRARTVGKVTAALVVETYPDGSFLVPCTLHCG